MVGERRRRHPSNGTQGRCHRSLALKGVKETGPVLCAGCHSKEAQEKIAAKNKEIMEV